MKNAFTLIELLVVVTIIVTLLALLVPAMDKAIYQAELAMCAANQNAVVKGANIYAVDYKRSYPYRQAVAQGQDDTSGNVHPSSLNAGSAGGGRGVVTGSNSPGDYRVALSPYMSMKVLVDPLCQSVDLGNPDSTVWYYASYALWVGWNYNGQQGMTKLGNRMSWVDNSVSPAKTYRVNWLITDLDDLFPKWPWAAGSHPDELGSMQNQAVDVSGRDAGNPAYEANAEVSKETVSQWYWFGGWDRGEIEMNAGSADGSVARYDNVRSYDDERMGKAPVTPGITNPSSAYPTRDGGSATTPDRWINIPIR